MSRRRQLIGALILLALAFITLDFRETGGPVAAMQRGADGAFAPLQGAFAGITRPIGDFVGSILEVGTLRSRVRELERDNAELREELLVQADLERRLREAEALLDMGAEQEAQLVGARVIASPPGTFERSVVIDVGANRGVVAGMAVINSRGVVGLVVETTATRARVNLMSSTEGRLGVRIAQTGDVGLLTGQGSSLLRLELFDSGAEVPLDAIITTQSFQGSLVPSGLPVGVLEPPPDGDPAGERFLEIRPYVDFSSLSTVAVVVAGREATADFPDDDVIRSEDLVPAPTVTREPDPDTPVGGEDPDATATEEG